MKPVIINEYKDYPKELNIFSNILYKNISDIKFKDLKGTGYIVNTLESSLYSFFKTNNYKQSIKKAISIGIDTDTIASITGGLAGLYYGFD